MRPHGQTKLGFFPLPVDEAKRLRNWLISPERFSAIDPCVGDGVAFDHLLHNATAHRYGIEIDAYRAEQASALGIETFASEHDGCAMPDGSDVLALPESPVRLGIWRKQQREIRIGLSRTHVSLAQNRRGAIIRNSATAIGNFSVLCNAPLVLTISTVHWPRRP